MSAKLVTYDGLYRRNLIFKTMRELFHCHFAQLLFVLQLDRDVAVVADQLSIAVRAPNNEPGGHHEGQDF